MSKKLRIAIIILVMIIALAVYIFEIVVNKSEYTKGLFRTIAVLCAGISSIIRISNGGRRKPLSFYERAYKEEIENVFTDDIKSKKDFLSALRFYNENKTDKAIESFINLKPKCKTLEDAQAVGTFLAVTFSDGEYINDAINEYKELIEIGVVSSTVYSNLGLLYKKIGNYDEAIVALNMALRNDDKNPYVYTNLASVYFVKSEFDEAVKYAEKSLELKQNFKEASTLLAIVYSIKNDTEKAQKYSHMAVASGQSSEKLKNAIQNYKTALSTEEAK